MPASPLRLVFAGTPDFAAAHLEALIKDGFDIVGAYSQPDRRTGRGKQLQPTPVKAVAQAHGIEVFQPLDFTSPESRQQLAALAPDVLVVVAYGLLLPQAVLDIPRHGCLNVHASLLPRWRGAAPIERALMAGDAETGVCIMQMETGLDTGPVLLSASVPILASDNSASLSDKLVALGTESLCAVLRALPEYQARAIRQDDSLATYASKLQKSEAQIDWQHSSESLERLSRALYPRSPAWFEHAGKRWRVISCEPQPGQQSAPPGTVLACTAAGLQVSCGQGSLLITRLQPEGKNPMHIADLLNGRPDLFSAGQRLGSD